MLSRISNSIAALLLCGAVLAFALVTDARGDGAGPNPFVSSSSGAADFDALVQLTPNGEHDSRVGAILAAHPDRDVLICLAGCGGGGPKVVTIREAGVPVTIKVAAEAGKNAPQRQLRPTSGKQPHPMPGVAAAAPAVEDSNSRPAIGDVICLAGCIGAPGEVVQEAVRLTWIDPSTNQELRNALRGLADRLFAKEAEAAARAARDGAEGRHAWMSDEARRMLLVEPALPSVLAALVRTASTMVERAPIR